jgi:hypothetical protein
MKPRPPVIVGAAMVSQLNSLPLLGVDPRRFLDLVVPACCQVVPLGRLRIVSLDDAIEALRSLANDGAKTAEEGRRCDALQPETVDQVLAALGMERTE